jgi:hypothetical protein
VNLPSQESDLKLSSAFTRLEIASEEIVVSLGK